MREILVMTSRTSARTGCRGREAGEPLGTGVFGQFSLTANRVVFWREITLVTSNGIKSGKVEEKRKSMRQEATKFEKFKRRKLREKPRKEKKRKFQ